jgi:hypothetical protein
VRATEKPAETFVFAGFLYLAIAGARGYRFSDDGTSINRRMAGRHAKETVRRLTFCRHLVP